ncbi:MAG: DUF3784 domain-containing protein [Lachnospiraceae bacterium]|nr:DUF3784 domain-containing protein [Lachnospiraceae bacterium]
MTALLIFGSIGILFIFLGISLWKKEKISLLHSYHYDKVREEDKKAFCAISGIGVFIIGIALLLTGIIVGITDSMLGLLVFAIGFVIGLSMLIYAGLRYNR